MMLATPRQTPPTRAKCTPLSPCELTTMGGAAIVVSAHLAGLRELGFRRCYPIATPRQDARRAPTLTPPRVGAFACIIEPLGSDDRRSDDMPKGGARTRSGPPPSMNALVRNRDAKTFTRLPRECTRPVPLWPEEVVINPTDEELNLWDAMWMMPQAHVWHADHLYHSVALYVRQFTEAAKPRASAQLRSNVRQLQTELLLTTAALTSQRYVIVDSAEDKILSEVIDSLEAGKPDDTPARPGPAATSAKDRLTVVKFNRTGTDGK